MPRYTINNKQKTPQENLQTLVDNTQEINQSLNELMSTINPISWNLRKTMEISEKLDQIIKLLSTKDKSEIKDTPRTSRNNKQIRRSSIDENQTLGNVIQEKIEKKILRSQVTSSVKNVSEQIKIQRAEKRFKDRILGFLGTISNTLLSFPKKFFEPLIRMIKPIVGQLTKLFGFLNKYVFNAQWFKWLLKSGVLLFKWLYKYLVLSVLKFLTLPFKLLFSGIKFLGGGLLKLFTPLITKVLLPPLLKLLKPILPQLKFLQKPLIGLGKTLGKFIVTPIKTVGTTIGKQIGGFFKKILPIPTGKFSLFGKFKKQPVPTQTPTPQPTPGGKFTTQLKSIGEFLKSLGNPQSLLGQATLVVIAVQLRILRPIIEKFIEVQGNVFIKQIQGVVDVLKSIQDTVKHTVGIFLETIKIVQDLSKQGDTVQQNFAKIQTGIKDIGFQFVEFGQSLTMINVSQFVNTFQQLFGKIFGTQQLTLTDVVRLFVDEFIIKISNISKGLSVEDVKKFNSIVESTQILTSQFRTFNESQLDHELTKFVSIFNPANWFRKQSTVVEMVQSFVYFIDSIVNKIRQIKDVEELQQSVSLIDKIVSVTSNFISSMNSQQQSLDTFIKNQPPYEKINIQLFGVPIIQQSIQTTKSPYEIVLENIGIFFNRISETLKNIQVNKITNKDVEVFENSVKQSITVLESLSNVFNSIQLRVTSVVDTQFQNVKGLFKQKTVQTITEFVKNVTGTIIDDLFDVYRSFIQLTVKSISSVQTSSIKQEDIKQFNTTVTSSVNTLQVISDVYTQLYNSVSNLVINSINKSRGLFKFRSNVQLTQVEQIQNIVSNITGTVFDDVLMFYTKFIELTVKQFTSSNIPTIKKENVQTLTNQLSQTVNILSEFFETTEEMMDIKQKHKSFSLTAQWDAIKSFFGFTSDEVGRIIKQLEQDVNRIFDFSFNLVSIVSNKVKTYDFKSIQTERIQLLSSLVQTIKNIITSMTESLEQLMELPKKKFDTKTLTQSLNNLIDTYLVVLDTYSQKLSTIQLNKIVNQVQTLKGNIENIIKSNKLNISSDLVIETLFKTPQFGFQTGGYTGTGKIDEVQGIVHKNEYVIPSFLIDKYRNVIQQIEEDRIKYLQENRTKEIYISQGFEKLSKTTKQYLEKMGYQIESQNNLVLRQLQVGGTQKFSEVYRKLPNEIDTVLLENERLITKHLTNLVETIDEVNKKVSDEKLSFIDKLIVFFIKLSSLSFLNKSYNKPTTFEQQRKSLSGYMNEVSSNVDKHIQKTTRIIKSSIFGGVQKLFERKQEPVQTIPTQTLENIIYEQSGKLIEEAKKFEPSVNIPIIPSTSQQDLINQLSKITEIRFQDTQTRVGMSQLHPEFTKRLGTFFKVLIENITQKLKRKPILQINSSLRPIEEQLRLYKQNPQKQQFPSPHNFGLQIDYSVIDPQTGKILTSENFVKQQSIDQQRQQNLFHGLQFRTMVPEPWHVQISQDWKSFVPKEVLENVQKMAKQFSIGGFTGDGKIDEIQGVVHKNEYVIPQFLIDKYKDVIRKIEEDRVKYLEKIGTKVQGFQQGGPTGGEKVVVNIPTSVVESTTQKVVSELSLEPEVRKQLVQIIVQVIEQVFSSIKNNVSTIQTKVSELLVTKIPQLLGGILDNLQLRVPTIQFDFSEIINRFNSLLKQVDVEFQKGIQSIQIQSITKDILPNFINQVRQNIVNFLQSISKVELNISVLTEKIEPLVFVYDIQKLLEKIKEQITNKLNEVENDVLNSIKSIPKPNIQQILGNILTKIRTQLDSIQQVVNRLVVNIQVSGTVEPINILLEVPNILNKESLTQKIQEQIQLIPQLDKLELKVPVNINIEELKNQISESISNKIQIVLSESVKENLKIQTPQITLNLSEQLKVTIPNKLEVNIDDRPFTELVKQKIDTKIKELFERLKIDVQPIQDIKLNVSEELTNQITTRITNILTESLKTLEKLEVRLSVPNSLELRVNLEELSTEISSQILALIRNKLKEQVTEIKIVPENLQQLLSTVFDTSFMQKIITNIRESLSSQISHLDVDSSLKILIQETEPIKLSIPEKVKSEIIQKIQDELQSIVSDIRLNFKVSIEPLELKIIPKIPEEFQQLVNSIFDKNFVEKTVDNLRKSLSFEILTSSHNLIRIIIQEPEPFKLDLPENVKSQIIQRIQTELQHLIPDIRLDFKVRVEPLELRIVPKVPEDIQEVVTTVFDTNFVQQIVTNIRESLTSQISYLGNEPLKIVIQELEPIKLTLPENIKSQITQKLQSQIENFISDVRLDFEVKTEKAELKIIPELPEISITLSSEFIEKIKSSLNSSINTLVNKIMFVLPTDSLKITLDKISQIIQQSIENVLSNVITDEIKKKLEDQKPNLEIVNTVSDILKSLKLTIEQEIPTLVVTIKNIDTKKIVEYLQNKIESQLLQSNIEISLKEPLTIETTLKPIKVEINTSPITVELQNIDIQKLTENIKNQIQSQLLNVSTQFKLQVEFEHPQKIKISLPESVINSILEKIQNEIKNITVSVSVTNTPITFEFNWQKIISENVTKVFETSLTSLITTKMKDSTILKTLEKQLDVILNILDTTFKNVKFNIISPESIETTLEPIKVKISTSPITVELQNIDIQKLTENIKNQIQSQLLNVSTQFKLQVEFEHPEKIKISLPESVINSILEKIQNEIKNITVSVSVTNTPITFEFNWQKIISENVTKVFETSLTSLITTRMKDSTILKTLEKQLDVILNILDTTFKNVKFNIISPELKDIHIDFDVNKIFEQLPGQVTDIFNQKIKTKLETQFTQQTEKVTFKVPTIQQTIGLSVSNLPSELRVELQLDSIITKINEVLNTKVANEILTKLSTQITDVQITNTVMSQLEKLLSDIEVKLQSGLSNISVNFDNIVAEWERSKNEIVVKLQNVNSLSNKTEETKLQLMSEQNVILKDIRNEIVGIRQQLLQNSQTNIQNVQGGTQSTGTQTSKSFDIYIELLTI